MVAACGHLRCGCSVFFTRAGQFVEQFPMHAQPLILALAGRLMEYQHRGADVQRLGIVIVAPIPLMALADHMVVVGPRIAAELTAKPSSSCWGEVRRNLPIAVEFGGGHPRRRHLA